MAASKWEFWIDRGGTFTDVIARAPNGRLHVRKLLSDNPDEYDDATIEAIKRILDIPRIEQLPPHMISHVKMGTTIATNALLERKGERVLLIVNRGFADALRIGYQDRPDIFARHIKLHEQIYDCVAEISGRVSADGVEIEPLNEKEIEAMLAQHRAAGIQSCAIVLMHSYKYHQHETRVAELARRAGFSHVSVSCAVTPLIKFVSRGDTTVADAYLTPVLQAYLDELVPQLADARALFMQSNGGLVDAIHFQGKNSLLSGPAGGVVGAVKTCAAAGYGRMIGFDMGGTSTDVSHFDGEFERTFDTVLDGIRMRAPMMAVHTVAAGGGSILSFDGERCRVGPQSAGANPGPACYRRGGPLTVTDCNLILGKLQPELFPHVFGPSHDQPIDVEAAREKFRQMVKHIRSATGMFPSVESVAQGFLDIAVDKMASAIKKISVEKGYDLTDYALCCFGGAGGQHACLIADALHIKRIIISPYAGVLSAMGIGLAEIRVIKEKSVELPLRSDNFPKIQRIIQEISQSVRDALKERDVDPDKISEITRAMLKSQGTDSAITVAFASESDMVDAYRRAHLSRYGFVPPDKPLIVEAVMVEGIGEGQSHDIGALQLAEDASGHGPGAGAGKPPDVVQVYSKGRWHETPVFSRSRLKDDDLVEGPAIIWEPTTTIVVEPGWIASLDASGNLLMQLQNGAEADAADSRSASLEAPSSSDLYARIPPTQPPKSQGARSMDQLRLTGRREVPQEKGDRAGCDATGAGDRAGEGERTDSEDLQHGSAQATATVDSELDQGLTADPVTLELFNNLFMSIAEEMGLVLQNTSHSVNIKERLDFSCALFDSEARLIANAPHIPVHLGSMSESVASLIEARNGDMKPGDVFLINDPYKGGTHLPDITAITPVFLPHSDAPLFYVASRGHHADIGGTTPGSMPPDSKTLEEEGVVLTHFHLVREGVFQEEELVELLASARFPARSPENNVADLRAQVAANNAGKKALEKVVARYGLAKVASYMRFVRNNAASAVRRALKNLRDGEFESRLDDGSKIHVRVSLDELKECAVIDFTGTSRQHQGNMNAPKSICKAAVLYVLRTLVDDNIPLNDGCLEPIELVIPSGSLINPASPAAVVAGNVETSQAIVDTLYGALGIMAASQGTMNNLTFGNERYQYYETICGGSGGGYNFDGTDAVHTHMTNSRLTDPEVLELRYPVLVKRFHIRKKSGGAGAHRGGNGVVREIQFREPMIAAILSQRRTVPPFGLEGGSAAACGVNYILKKDGTRVELGGVHRLQVEAGDSIVIETPGGGGFGARPEDEGAGAGITSLEMSLPAKEELVKLTEPVQAVPE